MTSNGSMVFLAGQKRLSWGSLPDLLNILKTTESHAINGWLGWYATYISIKPLKKKRVVSKFFSCN